MQLLHDVKDRVDAGQFLDGVTTIDQLCTRIEHLAATNYTLEDDQNKHKGDLFELYVEYLINSQHANTFIGISDYVPLASFVAPVGVTINGDYGMDGIGRSTITSKWAAVQAKYRGNGASEIHYAQDHLNSLVSQATSSGLFDGHTVKELKQHLLVITTAAGMDWRTAEYAFNGQVRCFGRKELAQFCDGHQLFWDSFKQSILDSQIRQRVTTAKTLRPHQVEAVAAVLGEMKAGVARGQVILPTGTGKTLIMARIVLELMRSAAQLPVPVGLVPLLSIPETIVKVEAAKRAIEFTNGSEPATMVYE